MVTTQGSLYNKYRPNTFSEVVGQDTIITILRNAVKLNRVANAYLFRGSRGSGKTSTARILCRSANCINFQDDICGTCDGCLHAMKDAMEIDAASNRGISDVTDLIETLQYRPKFVDRRFVIIDEAHQLTSAALNALLKIVEEPPKHINFIFCTTKSLDTPKTETDKAFATLSSRCQMFDFSTVGPEAILTKLKRVCVAEKVNLSDEVLISIVGKSDGSLRDAENILETAILLSIGNSTETVVNNLVGDVEFLSAEFLHACCLGTVSDGLRVANKIWQSGCLPVEVGERCCRFIFDVISLKSGLTVYRPSAIVSLLREISEYIEQNRLHKVAVAMTALKRTNLDSILSLELTVCDSQGDSLEASISNSFVDDGDFHVVSPDAIKW